MYCLWFQQEPSPDPWVSWQPPSLALQGLSLASSRDNSGHKGPKVRPLGSRAGSGKRNVLSWSCTVTRGGSTRASTCRSGEETAPSQCNSLAGRAWAWWPIPYASCCTQLFTFALGPWGCGEDRHEWYLARLLSQQRHTTQALPAPVQSGESLQEKAAIYLLRWSLAVCPGWPHTLILLISVSRGDGIAGVSHHTQQTSLISWDGQVCQEHRPGHSAPPCGYPVAPGSLSMSQTGNGAGPGRL
jgi:hypothetical protein